MSTDDVKFANFISKIQDPAEILIRPSVVNRRFPTLLPIYMGFYDGADIEYEDIDNLHEEYTREEINIFIKVFVLNLVLYMEPIYRHQWLWPRSMEQLIAKYEPFFVHEDVLRTVRKFKLYKENNQKALMALVQPHYVKKSNRTKLPVDLVKKLKDYM